MLAFFVRKIKYLPLVVTKYWWYLVSTENNSNNKVSIVLGLYGTQLIAYKTETLKFKYLNRVLHVYIILL